MRWMYFDVTVIKKLKGSDQIAGEDESNLTVAGNRVQMSQHKIKFYST